MSKQRIVEQFKDDWFKQPHLMICFAIFDYLFDERNKNLAYITYASLRKVVKKDYSDRELLETIQYLCGDRTHLLEARFELIEHDKHFDISNSELIEARQTGELLHPETGEFINDFKDKVSMYFQPSPLVKSLI